MGRKWKRRARWEILLDPKRRTQLDEALIVFVHEWFLKINKRVPRGHPHPNAWIEEKTGVEKTRSWKIQNDLEALRREGQGDENSDPNNTLGGGSSLQGNE